MEGTEHKFEIWMDHKNLEYIQTLKKLNQRQASWSLYLSHFDFTLHHRLGHSMGKTDVLSQLLEMFLDFYVFIYTERTLFL